MSTRPGTLGFRQISLAFVLLPLLGLPHAARAQVDCAVQTDIPQIQCESLLAISNALDGPNWEHQDRWLQDNVPCQWQRVKCHGNHRVEELLLGDNGLVGTVPPEIGNFPHLKVLNLGTSPGVVGTLPAEFGNLTRLETLWLGETGITGPFPPGMANLTRLKVIRLHSMDLELSDLWWLGGLQDLDILGLEDLGLVGHWPASWNNWPSIRDLDVTGNSFTGALPALGSYPLLAFLRLTDNNFVDRLPSDLGTLTALTLAFFSGNSLIGPLPAGMSGMVSLSTLAVSNNNLDGDIPPDFANMPALSNLQISGNCLFATDPAVADFIDSVVFGDWTATQCQSFFVDGFESGGLSAWSAVVP